MQRHPDRFGESCRHEDCRDSWCRIRQIHRVSAMVVEEEGVGVRGGSISIVSGREEEEKEETKKRAAFLLVMKHGLILIKVTVLG